MSDVDRTITTLQNLINGARNNGLKTTTVFTSTLSKCMALLKEQPRICVFVDADGQWHPLNMGYVKPVKPIRGGSGDGSKVWYLCGKCSNCVDDKDGNRDNFCSFCGSPVDWESADT